jgi:hypothetical protein
MQALYYRRKYRNQTKENTDTNASRSIVVKKSTFGTVSAMTVCSAAAARNMVKASTSLTARALLSSGFVGCQSKERYDSETAQRGGCFQNIAARGALKPELDSQVGELEAAGVHCWFFHFGLFMQ